MPSWNIHTAHVERLLADHPAEELGIADANAFLFGNYVPDIYVGYMVPDTTFRISYCMTHHAEPDIIPLPDADKFWNWCLARRKPATASGLSLALGAWAHLLTDRVYNERFRAFCNTHVVPTGEERRVRKQEDFRQFGNTLHISSHVLATPELLESAKSFLPYSILPDDVNRTIVAASSIVRNSAVASGAGEYSLLDAKWMTDTFEACARQIATWLKTWQQLENENRPIYTADVLAASCHT